MESSGLLPFSEYYKRSNVERHAILKLNESLGKPFAFNAVDYPSDLLDFAIYRKPITSPISTIGYVYMYPGVDWTVLRPFSFDLHDLNNQETVYGRLPSGN